MIVEVSPRTGWSWSVIVVLLLLTLLLGACDLSPSGEELVQQKCTPCHTLAPIEVAMKSEHEWRNTVYRMMAHGADLNRREAEEVIEVLAVTYGPEDD